jgi:hypothetical protein
MIVEIGLRQFLATIDLVTAIVGANIYGLIRERAPVETQLPAIMIQRTTTAREVLFCGTDDLVSIDLQVDSYAMTGDSAWGLARALRKSLIDFTGTMGDVYVDAVHLTNEFPMTDPDPGIIRIVQLYNFWYLED